jgi:hypothetical protein
MDRTTNLSQSEIIMSSKREHIFMHTTLWLIVATKKVYIFIPESSNNNLKIMSIPVLGLRIFVFSIKKIILKKSTF